MISSEKLCNSEWIEEKSQINAVINDVILGKPDEGQLHCYWIWQALWDLQTFSPVIACFTSHAFRESEVGMKRAGLLFLWCKEGAKYANVQETGF